MIKEKNTSLLNGLILVGGKSTRMGSDKSKLDYHGKSQGVYMFDLLNNNKAINTVFYSVRDNNQLKNQQRIIDKYVDYGPFGGICSAFNYDSKKAWLVTATDLPFVDKKLIKLLISKRNPLKIATTFQGINKDFPEPLITIWEPKAYPILKEYLAQNKLSLISVLKNYEVEIIKIEDDLIQNINTKEAYNSIKNSLK